MYQLIYWPSIQGRGEFIRLILEDAGAPYDDVARRGEAGGGGVAAVRARLHGRTGQRPGFAPPFLIDGDLELAQTPLIGAYLGERHGLAPADETGRRYALELALGIADLVQEVHDAHHPVGANLYYEDQKDEARRRTRALLGDRLSTWMGFFERAAAATPGSYLLGDEVTYVDLSLFQIVEGLRYAFPRASEPVLEGAPRVLDIHARVRDRPGIASYLTSERRIPFNEDGIFRHYPELDTLQDQV